MADREEDGSVQTRKSRTLIIRHLPADLTKEEKVDLLKYFGATSARVFSEKGVLKHTAFATFSSERTASKALGRLHQLQILNRTLVAEFAKDQDHVTVLKDPPVPESVNDDNNDKKQQKQPTQPSVPVIETGVSPHLGLKFQSNPRLKYLYPPPSNGTLANITHAILSVPKFYIQVLHLMNKMNLPCPFGPVTPRPPVFEFPQAPPVPMPPPFPPDYPPLPEEEMEVSSGEESEYESGEDEDKERIIRLMGLVNQACKRPLRTKASSKRKKPKLKDLLYAPKPESQSAPGPALQPSDVFEQPQPSGPKKIEFHISTGVATVRGGAGLSTGVATARGGATQEPGSAEEAEEAEESEAPGEEGPGGEGFGKIYPAAQTSALQEEDSEEDQDLPSDVISRKELEKGRLSRDEIKRMSVFKNYEPGEPTCRLYVKNIGKQVEEKDLKYIYGRYIDLSSEAERNMFDVVLMKEGRMKGQAFVGLPSERSAEKALRDTNGYVLYDKPLVVQFARSARPKPDAPDPKKGPKRR